MLLTALVATAAWPSESPRKSKGKSSKNEQTFTVVIDAGHGGHDHGAIDNGAREKDINLSVAKKFAAKVKKRLKNVNVVMTRDDDTFISLQERANIANRNKGNLFVSIHTNSVDKKNPNRKSVSGTSVYALGPQKDANNLKVAQRENSVIELEDNYHQKYSGFDPSKDESYIIFEMAQKKNLGQSLKFADKAQKELVSTAGRRDRGVKQAGFWVLWATAMPSVLVELDFICNPKEAAFISSEAGQEKMAEALTNALESYISAQHNTSAAGISYTEPKIPAKTLGEETVADVHEDEGVNTLASKKGAKSTKRVHVAQNNNRNSVSSRRRRSEASKQKSDNRSLETESINLTSEESYLAVKTDKESKVETQETTEQTADKNTKNKKKKKKDKKGSKKQTLSKNNKKVDAKKKKQTGNPNRKTFVVKKTDAQASEKSDPAVSKNTGKLQARNKTREQNGGATINKGTSGNAVPSMEYTIVLLSSAEELKSNDPAFCNLVPSGYFKENGLYKYTYGRSTDRKEIERILLDVKTVLPNAAIVVRMK